MNRPYNVFRHALIADIYESYLQDEEAPSLSAVRQRCYSAAEAAVKEWSNTEVAHWYLNYR